MRLRPSWLLTAGLAAAAACGGGGGSNTPTNQVTIADYQFTPQTLTVKAGSTVTWTNRGPSVHQTTSDSMIWHSDNLAAPTGGGDPYGGGGTPAGSFQFTFATPGTYAYHCGNHLPSIAAYAGFTGTIVVTP